MKKYKIFIISVLFFLIFSNTVVYASDINHSIDEIKEVIKDEKIESVNFDLALEKILETIIERDSIVLNFENKEKMKNNLMSEYIDSFDILSEETMDRKTFVDLYVKIEKYLNPQIFKDIVLIDIKGIFNDIENLNEEQLYNISETYRLGIISGYNNHFYPNKELSIGELDSILRNIKSINEKKVTDYDKNVNYSEYYIKKLIEESENLVYPLESLYSPLNYKIASSEYVGVIRLGSIDSKITRKTFLSLLNQFFGGNFLEYDENKKRFNYFLGDNFIIDSDYIDYCNYRLDEYITLGEGLYFRNKLQEYLKDLESFKNKESYESTLKFFERYIPNLYPIIKENKDGTQYFMKYGNSEIDNLFGLHLALHEGQHELSARRSSCFGGRKYNNDGSAIIYWNFNPKKYYYFDVILKDWIEVEKDVNVVNTSLVYKKMSDTLKISSKTEFYATKNSEISNIYGLYGLLQEYISHGVELDFFITLYHLGIIEDYEVGNAISHFLSLKILVIESLRFYENEKSDVYFKLLKNFNLVQLINHSEMKLYDVFSKYQGNSDLISDLDMIRYVWNVETYKK